MPGNRKHHKKHESSDESSTSSSSSSSSDVIITVEKHRKHHKKHKYHSESSSSSSDSSSSSSSSSHHKKKHPQKPCKPVKPCPSVDSKCSKDQPKCDFDTLYNYYKCRLLKDDGLMVGGSSAYINSTDTDAEPIPQATGTEFDDNFLQKNVEHVFPYSPFFVREAGIYILFFIATDDNASQWTVFVNGVAQNFTTIGTNAGAGQVICRTMLSLNKGDNILVRNYISVSSVVNPVLYAGGQLPGNNLTFLLMKIAPLHPSKVRQMNCEDNKCLKKKKLFKMLLERLLNDADLMLCGFNVYGSFYTTLTQSITAEQDVSFNNGYLANGIVYNPSGSDPTQIQVTEDGVYKIFFVINTTTPCQFCFCVNGVPNETTVQGTNKGAGQLTVRTLLNLKKNDIVSVRNHISNTPTIVTYQNAGGLQAAISNELTIFKIAPISKSIVCVDECKVPECYKECYETFKNYLLMNEHLQLTGSPAYFSAANSVKQIIPVNTSVYWTYPVLDHNIGYITGSNSVTIEKDGVYDIFADIMTNEAAQFTLFINGVPFYPTTSGRESGANRTVMRQFVKFSKGDVVTIRNWESNAGTLTLALNSGGQMPGNSSLFMLFLLSTPYCDTIPCEIKPCEPKPCEPKPCEPKPSEPKPCEPKPCEPKPCEPKPCEPKPDEKSDKHKHKRCRKHNKKHQCESDSSSSSEESDKKKKKCEKEVKRVKNL
jgi:hypothetical protein